MKLISILILLALPALAIQPQTITTPGAVVIVSAAADQESTDIEAYATDTSIVGVLAVATAWNGTKQSVVVLVNNKPAGQHRGFERIKIPLARIDNLKVLELRGGATGASQ